MEDEDWFSRWERSKAGAWTYRILFYLYFALLAAIFVAFVWQEINEPDVVSNEGLRMTCAADCRA